MRVFENILVYGRTNVEYSDLPSFPLSSNRSFRFYHATQSRLGLSRYIIITLLPRKEQESTMPATSNYSFANTHFAIEIARNTRNLVPEAVRKLARRELDVNTQMHPLSSFPGCCQFVPRFLDVSYELLASPPLFLLPASSLHHPAEKAKRRKRACNRRLAAELDSIIALVNQVSVGIPPPAERVTKSRFTILMNGWRRTAKPISARAAQHLPASSATSGNRRPLIISKSSESR